MEAAETPLEGEAADEQVERHDEIVLEGDGQLSLTIGGKKPNVSKVLLRGGQIPFTGEARKGDHLALRVECVVGEIHVIDKIDSGTRDVVETVRKHVLKVEGVELVGKLGEA